MVAYRFALITLIILTTLPVKAKDLVPVPQSAPREAQSNAAAEKPLTESTKEPAEKTETKASPPSLTIETEDAVSYAACIQQLQKVEATFTEIESINDDNGCGIDKPIRVEEILPGVKFTPAGTMRCETALQLALWTREAVFPFAATAFEKKKNVTALQNASDYVCRKRNNASSGKISEHARGNAVDIGAIVFSDGSTLEVAPRDSDSTLSGAFQRAIRASACLYFTTVLGPGSDEAHKNHIHLDVIKRNGGFRYCR